MNSRPSRDRTLMDVAWTFSKRSTCSRLQVGAVFSRNGRILVTGYNGAPAGLPHCNHDCNCPDDWDDDHHYEWCNSIQPCTISEHAERNAIAFAARNGVSIEGSELHVTHMPCLPCAMTLVNSGVQRVVYMQPYRLTDGVELLERAGIQVITYINAF